MTKGVAILSGALVLGLAVVAFIISFGALTALVIEVGIAPQIAWLYPTIIEGAIVIISLSILRAKLVGHSTWYPWVLVGGFTILSIVLNIAHAPANLMARVLSGVPPIALFLSFELFVGQVGAMLENSVPESSEIRMNNSIGSNLLNEGIETGTELETENSMLDISSEDKDHDHNDSLSKSKALELVRNLRTQNPEISAM